MKVVVILSTLLLCVITYAAAQCHHEVAFCDNGWVIHRGSAFHQILHEKLSEFLPEIGADLVLDHAECYKSDFSHDFYLIMSVEIFDRLSTQRDEMWGDVAFTKIAPCVEEYIEVRWYDPITKTKHIAYNPQYVCCCTTKVPLAYNTIF